MKGGFSRDMAFGRVAHRLSAGRWRVVAEGPTCDSGYRGRWRTHENIIKQILQTTAHAGLAVADLLGGDFRAVKGMCHVMPCKLKSGVEKASQAHGFELDAATLQPLQFILKTDDYPVCTSTHAGRGVAAGFGVAQARACATR